MHGYHAVYHDYWQLALQYPRMIVERAFVVAPVRESYPLANGVEVVPVHVLDLLALDE